jgi:hypothetical protein
MASCSTPQRQIHPELRSTASWRYGEQQDHLILDEIAAAEADRLAHEANQLYDTLSQFESEHPA